MKNAPLISLADIAESVRYGYTASASDTEIGPKFLRITDIVPPQIDWNTVPYCEIDEKNFDKFSLASGDLVIARTGATVGYAKLIRNNDETSVFASYLVRVRVDPDKADPGYVGRIVESDVYKRFVRLHISGAAQPNAKILSSFKLPIPERHVQIRIASILSAYDDLIENNRRRMQLLEQSAQLLYKEWFIYLRFPGHEHVTITDGVPEGWERKTFADVCETVGGGTPSTKVSEYWGGDVTWIVPTDVTKNDCLILLDSERKITERGLRESSAKLVPANTILMTSRASVGFFALMDVEVCTNQGFINIIPHDEEMRMYLLFNLMSRVAEICSNAKGTTYPEISKGRFRQMDIIIPTKNLIVDFAKNVCDIMQQVRYLKHSTLKLTQARDLLLPRLMNGEISV